MNYNGKIIVLAYPDTFVKMSDEWLCKFLPLVGLGTKDYIKAGHAALLLVENKTGRIDYFDFGRYITPKGFGRVRGANTDAELVLPMKAEISKEGALKNLEEVLVWLEAHPTKTHGEGRLLASVCDAIQYELAETYIRELQVRGSIPYGAFHKNGSNCSRFVTDTLLAATSEKRIIKALKFNKKFTPSTVGNVEKAALGDVYEVYDGVVKKFKGSALKENLKNYFDRNKNGSLAKKRIENDGLSVMNSGNKISRIPSAAQKLEGIGCNAWFQLHLEEELPMHHYRIKRYNDHGDIDFDGVYVSKEFQREHPFEFTYDSHCAFCHVYQKNKKIKFDCVGTFGNFNSLQKAHAI